MRYKPFLKIGKRLIGEKYFPLVIVEIGINHNGKIKLAKELIKIAQSCGAEIIKHQTHIPDDEMSVEAKNIIPVHTNQNIYDIILVLNYNFSPVIKKKGSAIFLHIANRDYRPTKGCLAISKRDMKILLNTIDNKTTLGTI